MEWRSTNLVKSNNQFCSQDRWWLLDTYRSVQSAKIITIIKCKCSCWQHPSETLDLAAVHDQHIPRLLFLLASSSSLPLPTLGDDDTVAVAVAVVAVGGMDNVLQGDNFVDGCDRVVVTVTIRLPSGSWSASLGGQLLPSPPIDGVDDVGHGQPSNRGDSSINGQDLTLQFTHLLFFFFYFFFFELCCHSKSLCSLI